jgi:uncharacterized protein YndB with AHSA1/START domain
MEKQANETDSAEQVSVSRTVAAPVEEVWDYLIGRGLDVWLGDTVLGNKGESYETADGVRGVVRSFHALETVRVTWQRPDDDHESSVQVSLAPAEPGTTVTFSHDRLPDPDDQERLQTHWADVAGRVAEDLEG